MPGQPVQHGEMVFDGEGLPPLETGPKISLPAPSASPSPPPPPGLMPGQPPNAVYAQIPAVATDGIPRFELVSVRLVNGTYENREYVTILIPGDAKTSPRHKMTDALREKYRPWYELWRHGLEQIPTGGTPLDAWPLLKPAEIDVMKINNIFTVEQLLAMADANDHRIPMAKTLKKKARAWLEAKKEADSIDRNRAEKDEMKLAVARLEEQNLALAKQVEDFLARGDDEDGPAVGANGKKPVGRPRKTDKE